MKLYMVFLALAMVALGFIGVTIEGLFALTVIAAIFLGLTVILGVWAMTRHRTSL